MLRDQAGVENSAGCLNAADIIQTKGEAVRIKQSYLLKNAWLR